jgi:2-hydroxychromene-2-carboxylate isomerase
VLISGPPDTATSPMNTPSAPQLEFWFEFGSTYSYLSVMRIEDLARNLDVQIAWKPFLLGPIFKEFGWRSSPFTEQARKGDYMWRDVARRAHKYSLEFNKPAAFPRTAVLPMRVAVANANAPWIGVYCRAVMHQHFVQDLDINTEANVLRALHGLVARPESILLEAQSAINKPRLRIQTEIARDKGIFGAPTFFVGTEMFWGDDRLEDAMDYCLRSASTESDDRQDDRPDPTQ